MIDVTTNPTINNEILKYSLEELKAMKVLSNTNGRPTDVMTDEKWQREFELRRFLCHPYPKTIKKLKSKYSTEQGSWNEETSGIYKGQTNWQRYVAYINDVLKVIESGEHDYCYYIYQIDELLKFHRYDLVTKYYKEDKYFEVWLDKNR